MSRFYFHFRVSDIPLVFTELTSSRRGYGMFESYALQEGDLLTVYCSERGIKQQYDYGKENLLNPVRRKQVFRRIEAYDKKLMAFQFSEKSIDLNIDVKRKRWVALYTEIKNLFVEFGEIYFIMESMPLAPLAEFVTKICERDGLSQDQVLGNISLAKRFSKEEIELVETLSKLGHLKFSVHTHVIPLLKVLYELLAFIMEAARISNAEAVVLTDREIKGFLIKGIQPTADLKMRARGVVFLTEKSDSSLKMGEGDEYKKWKKILEPPFVGEIKGTVACRGKVRGRVSVYLSWIYGIKIPAGNILVTGMTNPQMVPHLQHVAAIVTDEGGLTCHAAIISREMKIPCIVGTKVATRVLKDGDRIEVDATKGVVRRI